MTNSQAPEGFVSVELLNIERAVSDDLRAQNAALRASVAVSREEVAEDGLISTDEVFARVDKMILLADGDRDHDAPSALNCNQTMVALHLLRHLKNLSLPLQLHDRAAGVGK